MLPRSLPGALALAVSLAALALAGCRAPISSSELQLTPRVTIRGVGVGDLLPDGLAPLPTYDEPWELESEARRLLQRHARYGVSSSGDLFVLRTRGQENGWNPRVAVLAPRSGEGRRVALIVVEAWAGRPVGRVGPSVAAIDEWTALRRTSDPGVFAIARLAEKGPEVRAVIAGPDDILGSGLLSGLLPPGAPEGAVHQDFDAAFARIRSEAWSYERARPVLLAHHRLWYADYARGSMSTTTASAVALERRPAWVAELAALPTADLAARFRELHDVGAALWHDAKAFRQEAFAAHIARYLAEGRPYTAAGVAWALRPPAELRAFGTTPTAREVLEGAASPIPPIDVRGPSYALREALAAAVPGAPFPFREAAAGERAVRIDVAEEESVTMSAGVFVREKVERPLNPEWDRWEERGETLEREIAKHVEAAKATEDYVIRDRVWVSDRKNTVYVGKDGGEVGRTSELVGRHEETVVVGEDAEMRRRHEWNLEQKAAKERELAALRRSPPPRELEVRTRVYSYRYSGPVSWRVRVSGALEESFEARTTAEETLGGDGWKETNGSTSIGLLACREAFARSLAARLAERLAKLREQALASHLASIRDPRKRAEEAAWRRIWMGEPPAAGDAELVPVEEAARMQLRREAR